MSNDEILSKAKTLLQSALKLSPEEAAAVTLDTTPATVAGWTSMAHLELILSIEREFGITFEAEEIANLASMRAIVTGVGEARRRA